MSDEYEYGPWIDIPEGGQLQVKNPEGPSVSYRIATPKPKRELVVGKWYRRDRKHREIWLQCLFVEDSGAFFRRGKGSDEAIWYDAEHIDWSAPPRDEAPE